MNIGTYFDYSNHITFTTKALAHKIGTPREKAPVIVWTEVDLPSQLLQM